MTGGGHRRKVEHAGGQNRAVCSPAQGQGPRRGPFDIDNGAPGFEWLKAVRCQVFFGVFWVKLFNIQILIIQERSGKPPAQTV